MDTNSESGEDIGPTGFKCTADGCEKTFKRKKAMKRHFDVAHNFLRYQCEVCQKYFTRKSSLKRHLTNEHSDSDSSIEFKPTYIAGDDIQEANKDEQIKNQNVLIESLKIDIRQMKKEVQALRSQLLRCNTRSTANLK